MERVVGQDLLMPADDKNDVDNSKTAATGTEAAIMTNEQLGHTELGFHV